ncbi:hypothetical protein [Streptomyces poonensis]|uniref:Uncharacterized protein n=1 Tax=Streptomyces poonensis TaxID=68255 RepID=A0A918ULZ1_9ACTN|nr:hypothetical protein [Streptomyces poonensis]GGZ19719.1 hypothetical protein GCM10010365_44950 [Streptomyces poonensis]
MADGAGRGGQARRMIDKVLPQHCMRMQSGHGTKGTRGYDRARPGVRADDVPGGHPDGAGVLVVRRHRHTGKLSSPSSPAGRPATSPPPSS